MRKYNGPIFRPWDELTSGYFNVYKGKPFTRACSHVIGQYRGKSREDSEAIAAANDSVRPIYRIRVKVKRATV